MQGIRKIGHILSLIVTIVLAFLLAGNLYLIAARSVTGEQQPTLFGYSTAIVISGSMADAINVNDMVLIHQQKDYVVGDVISYQNGDMLVTHRIIEVNGDHFTTKGDANNAADQEAVSVEQVVGKVILVIPKIGLLIQYMRTPLGMLSIVLLGFLLVELSLHWDEPDKENRLREEEQ